VRKDFGIVPGIKQDALAPIFDKGSKAPIHSHVRGLAEGIVENGDLGLVGIRKTWNEQQYCQKPQTSVYSAHHGFSSTGGLTVGLLRPGTQAAALLGHVVVFPIPAAPAFLSPGAFSGRNLVFLG
jgi:hypothetical protein